MPIFTVLYNFFGIQFAKFDSVLGIRNQHFK
jgi:hypothetical protein